MKRQLTEWTENEIIQVLKKHANESYIEAAKEFGVSRQRAHQLYQEYKIEHNHLFDYQKIDAHKLLKRAEESTMSQAAREAGICVLTAFRVLKSAGLTYEERKVRLAKKGLRRCYHCKSELPMSEFHKSSNVCKRCNCTIVREYYHKNKGNVSEPKRDNYTRKYEDPKYVKQFYQN